MDYEALMGRALGLAASVRSLTPPNPWVGALVITGEGRLYEGATEAPGGRHAEVVALEAAGAAAAGSTLVVTLEPCSHHGRTPPCTDAVIGAGVSRVVVGMADPDPLVDGSGIARLREAGIEVVVGVRGEEVADQLAPYRKHRSTGRPYVTLKMAATLDGRIAAVDGSSRWITGEAARADVHRLRAESDAVLVGAGTVRADDPELTVRLVPGRSPKRVVLGRSLPEGARVAPAVAMSGELGDVLDALGDQGVLSLLVEGGARVAHSFHQAGLVDRYVLYLAPALMGGSDGRAMFEGAGAPCIEDAWRGRIVSVQPVGEDLRIEMVGR